MSRVNRIPLCFELQKADRMGNTAGMYSVKPPLYVWVRFIAASVETGLRALIADQQGTLSRYRVREVIPVLGEAPPALSEGWSVLRIESSVPISFSDKLLASRSSSVTQFIGVTQHLRYTSDTQREELDRRSLSELRASSHTIAVLIPIGKSVEWWKLARGKRYAYFQKSDAHEGHTAIGNKYVDRIFRKLYHSRHLNDVRGYDFLTYFEFKDTYEQDFRTLLAGLRDARKNPEWAFVTNEFEIWMTKVG